MDDIQLTPHFKLSELCTTTHKDLSKKNLEEAKKMMGRMYQLAGFAERVREILGKPMIITSGYRCPGLNKAVGGATTSQHCFDDKTEILTNNGWKNYKTISYEDLAFSYNTNSKKIELTQIDNIIRREHNGEMYGATTKDINYCVTDMHRMLVKTNKYNKKTARITKSEYTKSLHRPLWQFKLAKDLHNKRNYHLVSGHTSSDFVYEDINLLKLSMACICDGCVYTKKGTKSPIIAFNLSRQRKIDRLISLLKDCNFDYTIRPAKTPYRISRGQNLVYEIRINQTNAKPIIDIIGTNKIIPAWVLRLNEKNLKEILFEYAFFDGHIVGDNSLSISSINKNNIDMLQAISFLCGYKASFSSHISTRGFHTNNRIYVLSLNKKESSKVSEFSCYKTEYNGIVWCITDRNSTVIARRDGKVFVSGNCKAEALDFKCKGMTDEQVACKLAASDLKFQQLIIESNGKSEWVHISIGARREVLRYKNGKYLAIGVV